MNANSPKIIELRKKIDEIDDNLIELLEKRFLIAKEIIKEKEKLKIKFDDLERENIILKKIEEKTAEYSEVIKDIYKRIFKWVKTGKL